MKLYLAHNDVAFENELRRFIEAEMQDVKFYAYDASYTNDKVRANRLKGGFSARQSPFAVLKTDNDKFLKAFYSEVDECTVKNIIHNLLYYNGYKSNKQVDQPSSDLR